MHYFGLLSLSLYLVFPSSTSFTINVKSPRNFGSKIEISGFLLIFAPENARFRRRFLLHVHDIGQGLHFCVISDEKIYDLSKNYQKLEKCSKIANIPKNCFLLSKIEENSNLRKKLTIGRYSVYFLGETISLLRSRLASRNERKK